MKGYVYKIFNINSDKYYVGSTKDLKGREKSHFSTLLRGCHQNIHLQRSYDKWGVDSFYLEVVYEGEDYQEKEQHFLDTEDWDKLYNLNKNVSGGGLMSYHPNRQEIVEKIRGTILRLHALPKEVNPWGDVDVKGANNPNWKGGLKTLCSCGQKMAVTAKTCISCVDRCGENNSFYGRSHTEETKTKLRERSKGRLPPNLKAVSIEGVIYKSLADAGRSLSIPVPTVHYRCCKSSNIKFKDWFPIGTTKTEFTVLGEFSGTEISCDGVEYRSYSKASEGIGLSVTAIRNRVISPNYPSYYKI